MIKISHKYKIAFTLTLLFISPSLSLASASYEEENMSALVEAAEVYQWVKNGNKTSDGKPVVIVDIVSESNFAAFYEGDVEKLEKLGFKWAKYADKEGFIGHVPNAQLLISHKQNGLIEVRNDGPMDVLHQLGDAETINNSMQAMGLTKESVVVFTSADFTKPGFCDTRAYWSLRYWGMSKNNLKILNGGNVQWAEYIAKNHPEELKTMGLEKGVQKSKITRSSITVDDFPKRHIGTKTTIGEIFKAMDSDLITNKSVHLLDARTPSSLFMKDISKFEEYIQGYQLTLTEGENGAAKFHPNEFFPIDIKDSNMDVFQGKNGLIPIVLSSKGESFEGQLKGAVLTKGKTQGGELYDIGLSTLYNTSVIKDDNGKPIYKFFTSFKRPNAIATKAPWAQNKTISDMFTTLFPNKNEKIIVYCSSGSLASIEYFYLTEILDYKNVSIYDGSLMEWGNLTAFEPNFDNPKAGLHVVKADQYTWLPLYPMNMPAVSILASGESHPFHLEQKDSKFIAIDDVNGDTCVVNENNCWIKTGGTLKGDCRWDTLSKSEHILFRPTQKVNAIGTHEYNSKKDWVPVKVYPDYNGDATITKGTDAQ